MHQLLFTALYYNTLHNCMSTNTRTSTFNKLRF